MLKNRVTVFIEVFNEEARIESCLKSFVWADELIVFDKQSTDRTREIALKFATKVISVPFSQGSENIVNNITGQTCNEWVLIPTASSLMHPNLVDEIVKLTADENFPYDVIGMPYGMYSWGVNSRNSPWTDLRKYTLIRRSVLRLSTKLHQEISWETDRIYDMPLRAPEEVFYHCTNRDADDYFSRQIRYTRYEAQHNGTGYGNQELRKAFYQIIKAIGVVIVKRRTFILGWDGVGLALAYISYFIMKFIYVWDSHRDNGNVIYPILRKKIDDLWDQRQARTNMK